MAGFSIVWLSQKYGAFIHIEGEKAFALIRSILEVTLHHWHESENNNQHCCKNI